MLKDFLEFFIKNNYHLIVIYIIAGYVIYRLTIRIIDKSIKKIKNKRTLTIQTMINHFIKYVIIIITIIAILNILGVNVTSMLAGVGIISVIIGLALQDIMKDYLVGLSIVLEEHYDVGDIVEINGHLGTVKHLNLKTTTITTFENVVITLSNRTITEVKNYSKGDMNIILSIPMPYDVPTSEADKVINSIVKRLEKEKEVIKKVDIWDFSSFEDSYIKYKLSIPVKNEAQFKLKRKANRIIKEEYDKEGISVPFNIVEVRNGKNI